MNFLEAILRCRSHHSNKSMLKMNNKKHTTSMKSPKAKRWMKDGKEDLKLTGLIEGGAASFDKKPDVA